MASSLIALGLSKGDRVGIWGQNHLEWLVTFLASAKAGTILVSILFFDYHLPFNVKLLFRTDYL